MAIFQMGALEAPGPDGIPSVFYHKCWSIVGDENFQAVRIFFFQKGIFAKGVVGIIPTFT